MAKTEILGIEYDNDELIKLGKQRSNKFFIMFLCFGIGLGLIALISLFVAIKEPEQNLYYLPVIYLGGTIALISIAISKKCRKDEKNLEIGIKIKRREIPLDFSGNRAVIIESESKYKLSGRNYILFNVSKGLLQIISSGKYSKPYTVNDLTNFEIIVDTKVVTTMKTKKSNGKAIVGGLLLGEAGLVAGAVGASSKTESTSQEEHKYTLKLYFNDIKFPSFISEIGDFKLACDIESTLIMINKSASPKEEKENEPNINEIKIEDSSNKFLEIREY